MNCKQVLMLSVIGLMSSRASAAETATGLLTPLGGGSIELSSKGKVFSGSANFDLKEAKIRAVVSAPLDEETRVASFGSSQSGLAPGVSLELNVGYTNDKLPKEDVGNSTSKSFFWRVEGIAGASYDRFEAVNVQDVSAKSEVFHAANLRLGAQAVTYGDLSNGMNWALLGRAAAAFERSTPVAKATVCSSLPSADPTVSAETCSERLVAQSETEWMNKANLAVGILLSDRISGAADLAYMVHGEYAALGAFGGNPVYRTRVGLYLTPTIGSSARLNFGLACDYLRTPKTASPRKNEFVPFAVVGIAPAGLFH